MAQPVQRPKTLTTHVLITLDKVGGTFILQTQGITEPGDLGMGFYSNLDKAQKQQLILALKGIQTEIFTLEFPLPV